MKKLCIAAAVATMIAPAASALTIIDDFTTFQRVEDLPSGFPNTSSIMAPEAIGGAREMTVSTSPVNFTGTVLQSNDLQNTGQLSFSNADQQTGLGSILYDGDDTAGNQNALNFDLTSGGIDDRFFFEVTSFDQPGIATVTVTVTDTSNNVGTFSETLDLGFDPFLRFSEFSGMVDFSSVGSILFEIQATGQAFDGAIGSISVVPLPASALLLLGGLGGLGVVSSAKRRRRKA